MSGIPEEIPEYGDVQMKPRQNPEFSPGTDFGTEEYFVWSRCDGTVSLHDIILMVGLGTSKSIGILSKLRNIGAVLLPGESRLPEVIKRQASAAKSAPAKTPSAPSKSRPSDLPPATSVPLAAQAPSPPSPEAAPAADAMPQTLENPSDVETHALDLELELGHDERVGILLFRRRLANSNLFEILDVDVETDKRNIKRAYFRLSKVFHPDRHYGKELGPFEQWLGEVFKAITNAFKVLGDNKKRVKYEASLRGQVGQDVPQTKEEHASSLFQNACDSELQGDSDQALRLFAASIRMDEQPRYLRRAAMCAVQARELSVAEEYAKKAAYLCERDASYLRVLADVYRAGAQLEEAKEILERALTLNVENDTLYGELQTDLAAVDEAIAERLAAG